METKLCLLAPKKTNDYSMCLVLITRENNAIVIDGGRPEDMEVLKEYLAGRHISAWILTHAHDDHISGFVAEMEKNGGADFDIETVYYNFPPYSLKDNDNVPDHAYLMREVNEMLPAFNAALPKFAHKTRIVSQGDSITVDELKIDFLFSYRPGLEANLMNDASLVFKVHGPNKTVMFLGDLGPMGGDQLYEERFDDLKADIVQMAHHGHMCCGMEVYAAIDPQVCLWSAGDWLYDEKKFRGSLEDMLHWRKQQRTRMYGTTMTRWWMERLGVKEHYVTKDGTAELFI